MDRWRRCPADEAGGIAQLAEHELCKLGVTGSNPVASTRLRLRIVESADRVGPARPETGTGGRAGLLERGWGLVRRRFGEVGRVAQSVRARP